MSPYCHVCKKPVNLIEINSKMRSDVCFLIKSIITNLAQKLLYGSERVVQARNEEDSTGERIPKEEFEPLN